VHKNTHSLVASFFI